jgi:hypothetical protein
LVLQASLQGLEHVGTAVLVEELCWLQRLRCLHHHYYNYDDHDNNYHDNNDHDDDDHDGNDLDDNHHDDNDHDDNHHDHLMAKPLLPDALP